MFTKTPAWKWSIFSTLLWEKISSSADQSVCPSGDDHEEILIGVVGGVAGFIVVVMIVVIAVITVKGKVS